MPSGRDTKRRILALLASDDWEAGVAELTVLGQQAVSPLFSALCSTSPLVRWHAITAFGAVVSAMAAATPEKARVVMRRFIWSLNDESGGIGWGAPEAMSEIVCQSPQMAAEYHNHVLSYIHEDHCRPDCYLEHAPLRRGAVWGVARMAQIRPDLAIKAESDLLCALADCDATIRGHAAWACGTLRLGAAQPQLEAMLEDLTPVDIYRDHVIVELTLSDLAKEALNRISVTATATN